MSPLERIAVLKPDAFGAAAIPGCSDGIVGVSDKVENIRPAGVERIYDGMRSPEYPTKSRTWITACE